MSMLIICVLLVLYISIITALIVFGCVTLSKELKNIIATYIDNKGEILIVGLGNETVTPDSLGPETINEIEVTRHFINYMPQYVKEGTRMVSAISPGVLGTTGIETVEILKGVVQNINPKLVIVIDKSIP